MLATKTFSAWALKYAARPGGPEIFVPAALVGGTTDGPALFDIRAAARMWADKGQRPVHVLVEVREIPA
jgi:hypothetical protein